MNTNRVVRFTVAAAWLAAIALPASAASASAQGIGAPPAGQGDRPLLATSAGLLYVCNQDDATVSVIDLNTRRVVRTVDLQALGFSANARPHHIVFEPDGSFWYVSLIGEGKVVKLDREDRVAGWAPFETPGLLAIQPDGDYLLVGRSMSAVNPPASVGVIRRSDMSIDEVDVFFPRPHALVVEPRTGIAYSASLAVNRIAAVDPTAMRATLTDVSGPPHSLMQFALTPDGRTLAISAEVSHNVLLFDLTEDPLHPELVATIPVEAQPFDPVFSPDGRTLWLGNKTANTITAIDVAAREVVALIRDPRIRQPHGSALSADGRWILISNTNVRMAHDPGAGQPAHAESGGRGSIAVVDAVNRTLADVIEVGHNATGIAVAP